MIVKLFGQWEEANRILTTMQARWEKAITRSMMQEAHRQRGNIITNITSGGTFAGRPFAPLSAGTLIVRQFRGLSGTKPLIQTGAMRAAVSVVQLGPSAVFIGIRRTGKGGANLAAIHEYGAEYSRPMTDKQRRFLMAAFRSSGGAPSPGKGGGMLRVRIPARPFVGPVLERHAKPGDVQKRFFASLAKGMNGDFGG